MKEEMYEILMNLNRGRIAVSEAHEQLLDLHMKNQINIGYWSGKTRDKNTIDRLSESKHIKIVEYDINGQYKKTWISAKEIAIDIFKDYKVINGGAHSRLYNLLDCKTIKRKKYNNSYWFRESELIAKYNTVPQNLNIPKIIKEERLKRTSSIIKSQSNRHNAKQYSVNEYNSNNALINTYMNSHVAAEKLKISPNIVGKICRGFFENPKFNLKYGEKISQPIMRKSK